MPFDLPVRRITLCPPCPSPGGLPLRLRDVRPDVVHQPLEGLMARRAAEDAHVWSDSAELRVPSLGHWGHALVGADRVDEDWEVGDASTLCVAFDLFEGRGLLWG